MLSFLIKDNDINVLNAIDVNSNGNLYLKKNLTSFPVGAFNFFVDLKDNAASCGGAGKFQLIIKKYL